MLHGKVWLVALWIGSFMTMGADWPTYNADARRSAVTSEKLKTPLKRAWTYIPAQPPRPAWPEPGKEMHRMDFDYAPQPIVANGLVYLGSSADDTVRALDAKTGVIRWRFTTGGPMRFAPTAANGRLYVASDDGYLYCLEAKSGKLLWSFRAAPADDKLLGNGRMISRWPCRSGVLVDDDVAYVTAGMWPSDGIYVYALDAATGKTLWCNDTSGCMYISTPHFGADAFTGVAAQGYLALGENVLLVPAGRSVPGAYDRRTGRTLHYKPARSQYDGGAEVSIMDDLYTNATHKRTTGDGRPAKVGELGPEKTDGIGVYRLTDGTRANTLPGKYRALIANGTLYAFVEKGMEAVGVDISSGRLGMKMPARWTAPHGRVYSMAMAGGALVVGGNGTITTFDSGTGTQTWQAKVDGQARGLAIADGMLIVTTSKGTVVAFKAGATTGAPRVVTESAAWKEPAESHRDAAEQIIKRSGITEGYALVVGPDARLAEALAKKTKLHVIALVGDTAKASAERTRLVSAGHYGSRIAVQEFKNRKRLPFAPYFANLVVATGDAGGVPGKELYRVLRPCGGAMDLSDMKAPAAVRLIQDAGIPNAEVRVPGLVVRGRLPGAGRWRHYLGNGARTGVGDESRVRLPLQVLWFGGPGPDRMIDRHSRVSPPLYNDGRVFVTGANHVIAFDAYNGRELWSRGMTGVARHNAPHFGANICADDNSLYVALGDTCHRLDQVTGRTLRTHELPKDLAENLRKWDYVGVSGELLLGSRVFGKAVFALDKNDGSRRWTYKAAVSVGGMAIAFGDGKVFLMDAPSLWHVHQMERRGKKVTKKSLLIALDLHTGAELWRQEDLPLVHTYVQYAKGVVTIQGSAAYDAANGQKLWGHPVPTEKSPIIHDDWIITPPYAYDLRTGKSRMTTDILTGRRRPWEFARSYGCNDMVGAQGLLIFRSGTEGFFDLGRDGVTTFGGVKPGCGTSTIAGGGLVLHSEGSSGCSCGYNFQTSLALVPRPEGHEPWLVFQGDSADAPIKHLRLNFGAPGDHRDARGAAWLAYPRPELQGAYPVSVHVDVKDPSPYYRVFGVPKAGAGWRYGSGVRGEGRIVIDLVTQKGVVPHRVAKVPAIDGKMDDACWKNATPLPFFRNADRWTPHIRAQVCRDAKNLYVAYRCEASISGGKPVAFKAAETGTDAKVWLDDSLEIQLTDETLTTYVQFGVSCSGGTAMRRYTVDRGRWQWLDDPIKLQGRWRSGVDKQDRHWSGEVAIPLAALTAAGLDRERLQLNVVSRCPNRVRYVVPFMMYNYTLPPGSRPLLPVLAEPVRAPKRRWTVRLHFAESENLKAGERVFNVSIQGKRVLKDFDIVREAGGPRRAVVKEFLDVSAAEKLTIEWRPVKSGARLPPVLCGVELRAK